MGTTRIAIVLALAACGGCVSSGGVVIPPSRYDISPLTVNRGRGVETGMHVAAGLHWASASPKPYNPVDVGLGYARDSFGNYEDPTGPQPAARGTTPVLDYTDSIYLSTERRVAGSRHQRTWAGLRGEISWAELGDRTYVGTGISARVGWELFVGTKRHTKGAFGVAAVGVFMEAGVKRLPGGDRATATSAGLSVRLPFIAAK